MKPFLTMFAASALAMIGALFAYDLFVAQPRDARQQATIRQALETAGEAGLAGRREEAAAVADELQASVDRTIANARNAMAQDAAATDLRARIAEGLNRASMAKLAVAESYMSFGRWPNDAKEAGLGAPESYAVGAVTGVELAAEGTVVVRYADSIAPGALVRLIPTAHSDSGVINWRCEPEGFPDTGVLPSGCR